MANWWEVDSVSNGGVPATARGIAYYRHSAQDRQENSIPIQQDQVREWAREHGVEIIQEFADHGINVPSTLLTEMQAAVRLLHWCH
ncbi:MAG: recombinase family protein [Planctomycetota bacterium]